MPGFFHPFARTLSYGALAFGWLWLLEGQLKCVEPNQESVGVAFSVERGFHERPFELRLSTTLAGARIWYTRDGSPPQAGRTNSEQYVDPIPIDSTSVIRAQSFAGKQPLGKVETHTYFFVRDILRQPPQPEGFPVRWRIQNAHYAMNPVVVNDPQHNGKWEAAFRSLPCLSIATAIESLFGETGVYDHPERSGADWERPVSAEFIRFGGDSNLAFQVEVGLRIQGGRSRTRSPKHSMSLRFKKKYGPSRLERPIFSDPGTNRFDVLQLRGTYNNSWIHWDPSQRRRATLIRDQWMRDSLRAMGHAAAGRGLFCHLFLNGLYWGIYNLHEKPDAAHYAAYFNADKDNVDAVNGGRAVDGDLEAWRELGQIVRGRDWLPIQEALDVDNYIDCTLLNRFANNNDLKHDGNWRAAGGGKERLVWRIFPWDSERSLEGVNERRPGVLADPVGYLNDLFPIPEFRDRLAERVETHLTNEGALTPERNRKRWRRRVAELDAAIIAESARWGNYRSPQPYGRAHWLKENERLMNHYFPNRTREALALFSALGFDGSDVSRTAGADPGLTHGAMHRTLPQTWERTRHSRPETAMKMMPLVLAALAVLGGWSASRRFRSGRRK